jgi:hypothetical protein
MRQGINPEKEKNEKNILKPHRVVVVFYVPDAENGFFNELDLVLDKCLESLTRTINTETTNITLINNNSSKKVDSIIEKYKPNIEKYVLYTENKGKVYAVLNEVRAIYEPFVTISDADILFYSGWEKAVFEIFTEFPQSGVVSPMPLPYLSFLYNQSVFGFNSLKNNIKYGKFVEDKDISLYIEGTGLPKLIERKGKFNWQEKQFILKKYNFSAVVGAYHVVSTYRTEQFRSNYSFPELKFKNSYESYFIDVLADENGLYRLSTLTTFAYHIGNKIDDVVLNHQYDANENIAKSVFKKIKSFRKQNKSIIFIKRIIGRILIKWVWMK